MRLKVDNRREGSQTPAELQEVIDIVAPCEDSGSRRSSSSVHSSASPVNPFLHFRPSVEDDESSDILSDDGEVTEVNTYFKVGDGTTVRLLSNGAKISTDNYQAGKDGFCEAVFPDGSTYITEVPNSHLKGTKVNYKPAVPDPKRLTNQKGTKKPAAKTAGKRSVEEAALDRDPLDDDDVAALADEGQQAALADEGQQAAEDAPAPVADVAAVAQRKHPDTLEIHSADKSFKMRVKNLERTASNRKTS